MFVGGMDHVLDFMFGRVARIGRGFGCMWFDNHV